MRNNHQEKKSGSTATPGNTGQYSNPLTATLTGIRDLWKKGKPTLLLSETDRLDGKTVMITGASSGLGFAAALDLSKRGATVIMACRSGIPGKGEAVKAATGSSKVFMEQVDLSNLDSIADLTQRIKAQYGRIDILICNAAMVPSKSRRNEQGLEEMFVVNYLAKYLMVRLLIQNGAFGDIDKRKPLPRIIFVSSESHRNPAEFKWEDFGRYQDYGMSKTVEHYGYYKLLLTTFANELSRKLNSDKIKWSVFALCPGPVNTNIAREAPIWAQPLLKIIFSIFFRSPEAASAPIIYLAASSDLEGRTGEYLFLMNRKTMDDKATEPLNGSKLWKLSEQLLSGYGFTLAPMEAL